jgi:hypothetical protein
VQGQPAAHDVVAERGQAVAATDEVGHRVLVEDGRKCDKPGRAGPGDALGAGRARLCARNLCRVEAWRANIHEATRHESESAPVKVSSFNIGRLGTG